MTTAAHSIPAQRRVALLLGMLVAALGVTVLLGWFFDIVILKSIFPGLVTMKANTAIGMLLCGAALVLLSVEQARRPVRFAVMALAIVVIVLGALTVSQDVFGWNAGIDQLLFHEPVVGVDSSSPGRMSPSTALGFMMTGAAILLLALWRKSSALRPPVIAALASTVMLIGGFALAGQASSVLLHYRWWNYTGVAVHTAAGFVLLGGGLLALVRSQDGLTWALEWLTTAGFATGMMSLLVTSLVSNHLTNQLQQEEAWVSHTQEVLKEIQEVATGMAALENDRRHYIIMGDERVLKSREETLTHVYKRIADLRALTSDNPQQQSRLDRLAPLVRQRNDLGERIIAVRRSQGFAATQQMMAVDTDGQITDELNSVIKEMSDEEYVLLSQRQSESKMTATKTFLLVPGGAFLSLALLFCGLFFLNAGAGERKRAAEALREQVALLHLAPMAIISRDTENRVTFWSRGAEELYGITKEEALGNVTNSYLDTESSTPLPVVESELLKSGTWQGELEHSRRNGQRITVASRWALLNDTKGHPAGYLEVNSDITERKQAEEEVRRLNIDLEQRVVERTAQLEAANRDLEAFSYSVSHDLRAPLRAVDGFSQAIMEDFGPQLPEDGRRQLLTVRESAQRMGELIDDLLKFSRLGREPLRKRVVDTGELVRTVLADLSDQQDHRKIRVSIGDLPSCQCDPALLKQVWVNLISNALKYTGKREEAIVDIGCAAQNGERVYFIRDNGTGFDMRYADKLFGVFQRLHRAEEYQGTGVGLAIVQQIIQRHGGRVWAEAEVDRGATFYFTVGGETKS